MPFTGKHRRAKSASLTRGFIAVSAGGAVLALPLITAGSASAAPAKTVVAEKASASTSAAGKEIAVRKAASTTYSVVSGDSLYKIAQGYSLSGGWERLYKDNRGAVGSNPDLIHPGLKLTIGAASEAAAPKAAEKSEFKAETAEKNGDTAPRAESADRADRSERTVVPVAAEKPAETQAAVAYTDDLDGWIKESLAVMAEQGIPGSYDGIYRNIMRESSGNPMAINNWDINAVNGTPSKGLLQVIQPTFDAYHVPGTSMDIYDPVANITAACNYAAATYGSMDNVFGAY
ncbi:LysM peptidoglycan-binding domain-containing protein [Streptomyces sp. SID9727]|uniref:transglycosylase SLT domain-containing protein n=1 Tax=Streptomyces sp. SID9727 TaxID=2706114 RepID=UPI0013C690F4|nr:LysM peptidoglycan-binding domain-containing protein [Streptomyces sp. SID9727]NEC63528.1 transglycosylase SLT domain-containing protein [Streptomyces sp. SID9727]